VDWADIYQVLECAGCGHVTFRKRFWFSPWQEETPYTGPVFEDTYFPPPSFRRKPTWFDELDETLRNVLEEVYIALQNNVRYLAAVGARTALDTVLVDKVSDKGSFSDKLDELEKIGLVSQAERKMLEAVIEAGNAAAHRGFALEQEDLIVVMDILESVIKKLCVTQKHEKALLEKAEELRTKVPRSRREKH
jgi:hypothetical protein